MSLNTIFRSGENNSFNYLTSALGLKIIIFIVTVYVIAAYFTRNSIMTLFKECER